MSIVIDSTQLEIVGTLPVRLFQSMVHYWKGYWWITGGVSTAPTALKYVFKSTDLRSWSMVSNNDGAFGRKYLHGMYSTDSALYVYAGGSWEIGAPHFSIYKATDPDSNNWTLVASHPTNTESNFYNIVYFNGKYRKFGGSTNSSRSNKISSSIDGDSWSANITAAYPVRTNHTIAVVGSTLYIIGGRGSSGYLNDVWKTTDGETFTQVTVVKPFSARQNACTFISGNRIYLFFGNNNLTVSPYTTKPFYDGWYTDDGGANWYQLSEVSTLFPGIDNDPVYLPSSYCVTFNGEPYFLCGDDKVYKLTYILNLPGTVNVASLSVVVGTPTLSVDFQTITIPFTGYADPTTTDADITVYEYSTDNGATWETMTVDTETSDLTDLTFNVSGEIYTIVWEAKTDLGMNIYNNQIRIRLRARCLFDDDTLNTTYATKNIHIERTTVTNQTTVTVGTLPTDYKGVPGSNMLKRAPKTF